MKRPGRLMRGGLWVCLAFSCFGGLMWLDFFLQGGAKTDRAMEVLGPVQILANSQETWVFIEKHVRVGRSAPLVAFRTQVVRLVQTVVVVNPNGVEKRIELSEGGPPFEVRGARIFRKADGFYLCLGADSEHHRSIFKWKADCFDLVPLEQSEAWMREAGLQDLEFPELGFQLERISQKNGWKHLCQENTNGGPQEGPFEWNKHLFQVQVDRDPKKVRTSLLSLDPGNAWKVSLMEFDPSFRAMTAPQGEELRIPWNKGHPKKQ